MRKGYLGTDGAERKIAEFFNVRQFVGIHGVDPGKHEFVPGDRMYAIVQGRFGERVLTSFFWGFNPVNKSLFNTKVESAKLKKTWSDSYAKRRCIVPFTAVNGFGHSIVPKIVPTIPFIAIAGIYDPFETGMSVLTTAAKGDLDVLGERQPLIVPLNLIDVWLDRDNVNPDQLRRVINNESPYLQLALQE